uniref:Uncharacterized protein n=1 Tax=Oryza punctata TaxID=4537 RepID=A0A0E0KWC6_ORYPU
MVHGLRLPLLGVALTSEQERLPWLAGCHVLAPDKIESGAASSSLPFCFPFSNQPPFALSPLHTYDHEAVAEETRRAGEIRGTR